jgi:hypothetical protein
MPGSFSRLFLGSLEKYRGRQPSQLDFGGATQEAAAQIADQSAPVGKRSGGATYRLRSPMAIVETLLLTFLIPGIGWLIHKGDPFFLGHRFSWLLFAPLLLGLRHGFVPACASAIVLDGAVVVAWRTQLVPMAKLPGELLIGMIALAMLTGQFSDVWKREIVRLDGGFDVLKKQLNELGRAHFLLELSHDRLQEQQGKGTPNLRDAMLAVQRVAQVQGHATLQSLGEHIMDVLATYCLLEVATLHALRGDSVVVQPVAVLGRPSSLDVSDAQLRHAIRRKQLTYLPTGSSEKERDAATKTRLLAVVPLVDAWGTLHAIVCVESMPFIAFERRNLEALAILGGRFADILATGGKISSVERGRRQEFEIRLRRALRDLVQHDVPSTVFGLIIRKGSAVSDSIELLLSGALRDLDFPLVLRDSAGNYSVFILLPLTDEAGARALGARIERIVRQELNMPISRSGAFHFFHVLRGDDTVEGIMRQIEQKAHLDEGSVEVTIVV